MCSVTKKYHTDKISVIDSGLWRGYAGLVQSFLNFTAELIMHVVSIV